MENPELRFDGGTYVDSIAFAFMTCLTKLDFTHFSKVRGVSDEKETAPPMYFDTFIMDVSSYSHLEKKLIINFIIYIIILCNLHTLKII